MKKIFFVTCLMLSAMMVSAETMRVAILEPVDRENKVSYANRLILRSNLAKAVTNTPGYEAYDRSDIDAIMGEQDFQRTGLVSNDQIRRLGEMTGAKYVLVAEAAVVDANNMYITVKLLNVETAKLEMTDNKMMGMSPAEIQKGCVVLANNLFGRNNNNSAFKTTSKDEHSTPSTVKADKSDIVKISNNLYSYNGRSLNKNEYETLIRNSCPQAYKQYRLGKSLKISGWSCFATGLWAIGVGIGVICVGHNDSGMIAAGATLCGLGSGATAASVPLLAVGYVKQNRSVDTYNVQCKLSTPISFNLTSGQNGLGLAIKF